MRSRSLVAAPWRISARGETSRARDFLDIIAGIGNAGDATLKLEQIRLRETWSALAPGFHIADEAFFRSAGGALPLGDNQARELLGQLVFDGYFQESGLDWGVDLAVMAGTVRALARQGIAPVFAFVFDEFWLPFHRLRKWHAALLGDYAFLPDFWAWNLDPARGGAGWPPHRDKDYLSLRPDGSPKSLTTWIPISPATPLNGCMYIVPASSDPAYGTPRDKQTMEFELPSVRALPAQPGDVLMWNQAVMHWGGRCSPRAPESRVSMAFELQRADMPAYNQPLLKPGEIVGFDARLKLIGKQILQYRHFTPVDAATETLAFQLTV